MPDTDSEDYALDLVFKEGGGVELLDPQDVDGKLDLVLWASDSDPDFMDRFPHELLGTEEDAEAIMDYLIEIGQLTEEDADELNIFGPGDDDDGDDDEDDDD